jgi:hypothetical protein
MIGLQITNLSLSLSVLPGGFMKYNQNKDIDEYILFVCYVDIYCIINTQ